MRNCAYYKTTNLKDFFFVVHLRLINDISLYRGTRTISISQVSVPRHLGNSTYPRAVELISRVNN